MNQIKRVEIHEFTHTAKNLGLLTNANTIGAVGYAKGKSIKLDKYAVVIETTDGCRGEYVIIGVVIKLHVRSQKC